MHPLELLAYFVGGAAIANTLPHLVSGLMGRKFPSPFAKPPGKGQSSAVTNVVWGFANLVLAYVLVCRVGRFDLQDLTHVAALGLGLLALSLLTARQFGSLNEGRGPDLA
jgi:hypothetical protein